MILILIDAPHFCASAVYGQTYAPIIAYMRHWSLGQIKAYCKKKSWTVTFDEG